MVAHPRTSGQGAPMSCMYLTGNTTPAHIICQCQQNKELQLAEICKVKCIIISKTPVYIHLVDAVFQRYRLLCSL